MDTRSKILTPAQALDIPARPLAVVTGTFDVLRAEHARELHHVRDSTAPAALLVIVLPCAGEILPQHARAELVAALRAVDYVVAATALESVTLLDALQPAHLFRLDDSDERRSRQLRDHVRARAST